MFKRKSNLPPRPKIPTVEQIIEDLSAVTDDNQFLNCVKVIVPQGPKSEDSRSEDAEYQNVKSFLKQDQNLQKTMDELKKVYENLQASSAEISLLAEDLKEQTVKALL